MKGDVAERTLASGRAPNLAALLGRGARLEAFVAVLCKKPVFNINTWETISPQDIVSALLHSIEP